MALPIEAVQRALREEKLDGWLLYDFQGFNPIASRLVGLAGVGQDGDPALVLLRARQGRAARARARHRDVTISTTCRARSASTRGASSWPPGCEQLLKGAGGWRWNTRPATPFRTCPASTPERSRPCGSCGATVVSSGDLAQRFEAIWSDEALATHLAAAERLYRIKDRAFDLIRQRMSSRGRRSPRSKSRTRWSGGSATRASSPTRRRTSRRRRTPATRTIRPTRGRAPGDSSQRGRAHRSLG